jgi:hypothetical protein
MSLAILTTYLSKAILALSHPSCGNVDLDGPTANASLLRVQETQGQVRCCQSIFGTIYTERRVGIYEN